MSSMARMILWEPISFWMMRWALSTIILCPILKTHVQLHSFRTCYSLLEYLRATSEVWEYPLVAAHVKNKFSLSLFRRTWKFIEGTIRWDDFRSVVSTITVHVLSPHTFSVFLSFLKGFLCSLAFGDWAFNIRQPPAGATPWHQASSEALPLKEKLLLCLEFVSGFFPYVAPLWSLSEI